MATDNMETNKLIEFGDLSKLLKEYRESAHLDVDQIADALCLTKATIRALENEDFDALPESTYIRGYLRNYARLAGEDPTHIVEVYSRLRGEPSQEKLLGESTHNIDHKPVEPLITQQRFRLGLLASLLLLLGLLTMVPGVRDWTSNLWSGFSDSPDTTETKIMSGNDNEASLNLPSLTGDVPGNLPLPVIPEPSYTPVEEDVEKENNEAATTSTDSANTITSAEIHHVTKTTIAEPIPPGDIEVLSAQPVSTSGNTELRFVFSDEVWLRIKNDKGKTLYEGLHSAGTVKELSLKRPLKLKIGNADATNLYVNGEIMNTGIHTQGSVAKFSIE